MKITYLFTLLFFLFTQSIYAQQKPDSLTQVLIWGENVHCAKANLNQVEWMQGNWEGPLDGNHQQHIVFSRNGNQMPGFARGWTNEGGIMFYEINTFTEVADCLEYRVKHMNSELSAWEGADGFIRHRLIAYTDKALYFDGITFVKKENNQHTVYFRIPEGENEGQIVVVNQTRTTIK